MMSDAQSFWGQNMDRNKVRGMVIGGAIGDALGMPVETWTPEKIAEVYPNGIERFIPPTNHKWFDPEKTPAGSTTDDTQLTLATMRGLIAGHAESKLEENPDLLAYYMHGIVRSHVAAMRATTDGWGHTTRDAIRRLSNGVSWQTSGKTTDANRGTGNGVPMKCSPLAAWYLSPVATTEGKTFNFHQMCVDYSAITHYTKMSAQACVCHVNAMIYCLQKSPSAFDVTEFLEVISDRVWENCEKGGFSVEHLNDTADNLEVRMLQLYQMRDSLPSMTQEEIIAAIGNGSCYVYDSLPFSYAWFVKNPHSFQILQQVIQAGGDTDTNAKIVGEMLGALHGFEAIQTYMPWAMDELIDGDKMLALADKFCDTFGIE